MSYVNALRNKLKRLNEELDGLQQEWRRRHDKVKELRLALAIEVSPASKFQLKQQIQEEDTQLKSLDHRIQEVEKYIERVNNEQIHSALFRLNYVQQVQLFREFIEEKRIGAFLVHGSPEHGQIFLLKRLLQAIPDSTITPPIQFYLSRRALRTDIAALWREFGRQMGVQNFSSHEEIAKNVVSQLQTQHVILVFHDFDCIDEDYLHELMRDFWLPLVNSVQQTIYPTNEFFLLMFLVDHEGCVSNWKIQFANQLDPVWEPCIPIRLPIIDRLSDRVLASWMENAIDTLPTKVTRQIDSTVQVILEKSEGVPEHVFAQIFGLCGCNWQEEEVRWLEL